MAKLTKWRNYARFGTIKALMLIERLNEFKTGKRCLAKVYFAWNIGIGYHRRVEENSVTEFYLFPLTLVTITTFNLGASIPTVNTAAEYPEQ